MNPSLYINPCFVTKTSFHSNSFVLCSLKAREPDSCYKLEKSKESSKQKFAWEVYLKGWTKNGFSKKKIMNQLKPIQTNLIIKNDCTN
jgi:hypothetical protein